MSRRGMRLGALAALLVAGLALTALPTAVEAQRPAGGGGKVVADALVHGGGVEFRPLVSFRSAVVTVSGGGLVFRERFAAGARLSIGVFDPAGQLLPDGIYRWELELRPDDAAAASLRAAAEENGGKAPGAWLSHSGSFAVRNGLVASGAVQEASAARDDSVRGGGSPLSFDARSERGAVLDDDLSVASLGVEGSLRAMAAQAAAAPSRGRPTDEAGLLRSDAATAAMGEPVELLEGGAAGVARAPNVRRSDLDNNPNANGRSRSDSQ